MYNTGSRLTRASPAFLSWRCAFARRLGRCTDSWESSAVARPEVRAPRPRSAEPQDDGNMAGVQASLTGLPYSEEVMMYSKTGGKDFRTLLNTLHLFLVEKKYIVIINISYMIDFICILWIKLGLDLRKRLIKYYVWRTALYKSEKLSLVGLTKTIQSVKMWCWRI